MAGSAKDRLLVHAAGPEWAWWRLDRAGKRVAQGQCLPEQSNWPSSLPVTIALDAAWCVGLRLDVPPLSARRQQQALRWAAEEYLAGSAEDEHVVAGPRTDQGQLCVVVIAQQRLQSVLDHFADGQVDCVLPDALCLPWSPGELSVAARGDQLLFRWGPWDFAALEADLALDLLPPEAHADSQWRWRGGNRPAVLPAERFDSPSPDPAFESALLEAVARPPINLLVGPFSPGSSRSARHRWQWAAGLLLAVVLALGLSQSLEYRQLRAQSYELQQQIDAAFQAAFPGLSPAGRHRELAERELARMRLGASADLLSMMSRAAPVIDAQAGLLVDALNYRDGSLELNLRAPDVAALESLERRLNAAGLNASVQTASMGSDGANGRIRIREAGR